MADGGARLLAGSKADLPPISAEEDIMDMSEPAEGVDVESQLEAYRDFKNAATDEDGLLALKDLIALLK